MSSKESNTEVAKNVTPSLYHHVSTVKPKLSSFGNGPGLLPRIHNSITFRSEIIPDTARGTLTTGVLYSHGSDIYEIDCALPLSSFHRKESDEYSDLLGINIGDTGSLEQKDGDLPQVKSGSAFKDIENRQVSPKWVYQGETILKMSYLDSSDDSTLIVMSKNGSLGWFRDGIKVPIHIVQEMMGPMTTYAAIHSKNNPTNLALCDFGLSMNSDTLVKSQSNGSEEDSILKIIDNAGKPGDILRTIHVPGTTVTHTVRFFDNHFFASCSDDNTLRFWDTRTAGRPLFNLCQPQNGRLNAFDTSQVTNELFATGSSTGVIKLWDVRAVENATTDLTNRQNGEDPIQKELVSLYHSGGDSVIDVQFSDTCSSEFITVGKTGSIYHWDMEYLFSRNDDDLKDDVDTPAPEELQGQCLKFFHAGNVKKELDCPNGRNMVALHPIIDNLVGTVDLDCQVTVYKPFLIGDHETG